jgi:dienelactone hydrolase
MMFFPPYYFETKFGAVKQQVLVELHAVISNAVAFGYCFGGAAALELARSRADLKGFATCLGGLKIPQGQNYAKTRGKIEIVRFAHNRNDGILEYWIAGNRGSKRIS